MFPGEHGQLWVRGPPIMKGMHIHKYKNTFFLSFVLFFCEMDNYWYLDYVSIVIFFEDASSHILTYR